MNHLTDADLDRIENELAGFRYSAWYDEQITALVAEVRRLRAHTTTTLVGRCAARAVRCLHQHRLTDASPLSVIATTCG